MENGSAKIFEYMRENKFDDVIKFIDNNPTFDYNIKDAGDTDFIIYVINANRIDILKRLVATNIRIDICDENGMNVLYYAIKYGFVEMVKELLKLNDTMICIPIYTLKSLTGRIPLHYAITYENIECFDILLPLSNCETIDNDGNNALHIAVKSRNLYFVKKVLKNIRDINSQTKYGETALHIACRLSLSDITEYLLNNGANTDIREYYKLFYPIHYVCSNGDEHILKLLIDHGADINIQDGNGNTPLHHSIISGKFAITKLLMTNEKTKNKINCNLYNVNLNLPLHCALQKINSNVKFYIDLLLRGTDINFSNNNRKTCLHYICEFNLWRNFSAILETKKMDILIEDTENKKSYDFIDKNDIPDFVDLVTKSYVHQLVLKGAVWRETWENECVNDKQKCFNSARSLILYRIKNFNKLNRCYERTYPIKKNSKKCFKINIDSRISLNTIQGRNIDIHAGLIYLKHTHKDICIIGEIDNDILQKVDKNILNIETILNNYFIVWKNKSLVVNPKVSTMITKIKSLQCKYVVFYLSIIYPQYGGMHANILMYSKDTNTIERFEPLGVGVFYGDSYDNDMLDAALLKYFQNCVSDITYISPKEYLPNIGIQMIEISENKNEYIGDPEGYCVPWSIWYCDMRVSYPNIKREKLMNFFIRQVEEKQLKYRSVIRNYAVHISDIRDYVLHKANIDINQYINEEYTINEIKTIVYELMRLYQHPDIAIK